MGVAFVTGASGFVGRHLVRAPVARGDLVRGLARSQQSAKVVASLGASPVAGDLEDDAALTDGKRDADVVYHLAARVEEWGRPVDFQRDNVDATVRVVAAARRCGAARLIFISSRQAVAGREPLLAVDESAPYPRVFFLADDDPVVLRSMVSAQLASVGLQAPSRSLSRMPAGMAATVSEAVWRRLRLRGSPPLTWAAISVVGQTCTVDASKAKQMLGYTPTIDRHEGFDELDVDWTAFAPAAP